MAKDWECSGDSVAVRFDFHCVARGQTGGYHQRARQVRGGESARESRRWLTALRSGSGLIAGHFGEIMSMTSMMLTALFMKVPEGYVAFIEELPGANTQGATLDEARENLHEAVALVLDANRTMSQQSLEGAAVIRETFVLPAA